MKNPIPEIFISYAWEKQNDATFQTPLIKSLEQTLKEQNFDVKIDINSIQYKDNIKEFMRNLGKGNYIVVVITEKYLKSKNCMFEVLEMLKYADTRDRIFPIISSDAKIYESLKVVEYIKYWDAQIKELTDEAKSLSNIGYAALIFEDIELMHEIRRILANFGNMLREMNVLTPEIHNNTNFKSLLEKINSKIEFDKKNFEIHIQNERMQKRISELEVQTNSLKLENSKLIIDIETYQKTIAAQELELLKYNDFKYINERLEEYQNRILKFKTFLGINKDSTKDDVIEIFGNPTAVDDKNDNFQFYSLQYEQFILIYLYKSSDKVMSLEISTEFEPHKLKQYLEFKSVNDSNITLLNQKNEQIFNYLGKPTDIRSGRFTYESEEIYITFTCYEFNEYKCSSIEITY
jgi:hypothetical protein